ncbi:hypothetical protein [Massilia sp. Root351]|jgi:hypothetical protein|uniref:hypothetical protein n=1 Tax=Massilia sp. Root351 TaxID=1736522 RepID=UPI000AA32BB5|nr:hypothetical protein [Massilia sp. Root351]
MLFVFCHEVVTAAHRHGQRTGASCAPAAGFVAMMELDPALAKRWPAWRTDGAGSKP